MASTTSVGMPSSLATTLLEPPGRQVSGGRRAGQAVGGLVDRAVAAEGDHDVVALAAASRQISIAWPLASVSRVVTS